jgi:hypothetical protein
MVANTAAPPAQAGVPEAAGDFAVGRLFDKDRRDPRGRQAFAPILEPAFMRSEHRLGMRRPARLRRRRRGVAAELLDTLVNHVEIVGGAGSGHVPSWDCALAASDPPAIVPQSCV